MSDESTDASSIYESSFISDNDDVLLTPDTITDSSSSQQSYVTTQSEITTTDESQSQSQGQPMQAQPMDTEPLEGQVFEVPLVNVVQESVVISRSQEVSQTARNEREVTPMSCSPNDDDIKPRKGSNSKKRKRPNRIESESEIDDDDGSTCPICLDHWELIGKHRLVSLKCGHLFGESCILRWLKECSAGNKLCPQCKKKALVRDIRYLYATKIRLVDNSEAVRLQKELDEEKQKVTSLQMELQMSRMENKIQQNHINTLQQQIAAAQYAAAATNAKLQKARTGMYKIFLEKTIEVSKEAGCRVMAFSRARKLLLASQKSAANIFPGYGIRFIDATSLKTSNYLHISTNSLRDMCFDAEESLFVAASSEKTCKLYDVNSKNQVETFTPTNSSQVWSCHFDKSRTKMLYLGTQHGTTFVYDIRQPRQHIKELTTTGDMTPVINIWSVSSSNNFPYGGCLVCKLASCWFFEYTQDQNTIATRLNLDGPFVSMQYEENSKHVLINARPSANHPTARHILADLVRLNESMATLQVVQEYHGSKVQSQISRSSQINYRDNVIVAAYCEDQKVLQTWCKNSEGTRTQTNEKILDTCPVYLDNDSVYLAALTESKCRAYKLTTDFAGTMS